jgi:hypothetical protein
MRVGFFIPPSDLSEFYPATRPIRIDREPSRQRAGCTLTASPATYVRKWHISYDALVVLKVRYGVSPSRVTYLSERPESAHLARCGAFRRTSPF